MTEMSKAEREQLAKLVRMRAKIAKEDVAARQAQVLAEAESALSRRFDEQDQQWESVTAEARAYMDEVQAKINALCDERGVPVDFRPGYMLMWMSRGQNASSDRRAELRRTVKAKAEASAKAAKLEIERQSVEIQTNLAAGMLESAEAKRSLDDMPTPVELMPALELPQIEAGGAS